MNTLTKFLEGQSPDAPTPSLNYNRINIETWIHSQEFEDLKNFRVDARNLSVTRIDGEKYYGTYENLYTKIWDEMSNLTSDRSNPTTFIAVILTFSEDINIEKAFQEWDHVETRKNNFDDCICGKRGLEWNYLIHNSKTKNIIHVGSVCIDKWKEMFSDKFKESLQKAKRVQNQIKRGTAKYCAHCRLAFYFRHTTDFYCSDCLPLFYRPCDTCKTYSIDIKDDSNDCLKCQKKKHQDDLERKRQDELERKRQYDLERKQQDDLERKRQDDLERKRQEELERRRDDLERKRQEELERRRRNEWYQEKIKELQIQRKSMEISKDTPVEIFSFNNHTAQTLLDLKYYLEMQNKHDTPRYQSLLSEIEKRQIFR